MHCIFGYRIQDGKPVFHATERAIVAAVLSAPGTGPRGGHQAAACLAAQQAGARRTPCALKFLVNRIMGWRPLYEAGRAHPHLSGDPRLAITGTDTPHAHRRRPQMV